MTELWYRLNVFAEKPFINDKFADGVIVPANLIAYYEIAMPELLNECKLPFLIDPMSFVWGIDAPISDDGKGLRKSFTKLVEKLNCSTASMLGKEKIQTIQVGSSEFDDFILNFLRLQMINTPTLSSPRRQSIDRIKRFKQKQVLNESACFPYALIPPYFYFETVIGNSYQRTFYAANKAKDFFSERKIFPCLCMSKSVLAEDDYIETLVDDFKGFAGINLWIDDFDETNASFRELTNFSKLIQRFRENQLEVVNFYGGFFSLMLHHAGLSKLSCGICYSRSKQVQSPQGGGGLPIRYYEPHLKRKLPIADMAIIYSEIPALFTCSCPICSTYSENFAAKSKEDRDRILVDFFTGKKSSDGKTTHGVIDWEKSRLHFLYSQKAESEQIENESLNSTLANIRENYDLLKRKQFNDFRYGSYEYLRLWADSLQLLKV